jgi:hypothetical protein
MKWGPRRATRHVPDQPKGSRFNLDALLLARFCDTATASGDRHFLIERLFVLRHKIANARCGPSDERLDIVREAIITISGVEACHGQEESETWPDKSCVRATWSRH